jgi:hypothetical protein
VSRRRIVIAGLAAAALAALGGLTCRRGDGNTQAPQSEASSGKATSRSALDGDDAASEPADPSRAEDTEAEDATEREDGGTFARVTERYREHDLRLIADVQRQTGTKAPDSVDALLRLRDDGADRQALEQHIDDKVRPMLVQAACRRWLAIESGEEPPATQIGAGGGRPAVKAPVKKGATTDPPAP